MKLNLKKWFLKNKFAFIGAAIGAIAGFLYWKFVGCASGTCAITSNPVNSTIYFGLMGFLLISSVIPQKTKNNG